MILSAQSIRLRVGMITPFSERTREHGMTYGLGPAGYDVRVDEPIHMGFGNEFMLAATIEHFNMPHDVLAQVCDKSTLARRGLFVQNTVIEPGWRGFLTLELTYHPPTKDAFGDIRLPAGAPIAQILFMRLDVPTAMPYEGKYQDQERGAQAARFDPLESS